MTQMAFGIEAAEEGLRLDQVLARKMPEVSRARVQRWIKTGLVQVNQAARPANYRVRAGDHLMCTIPPVQPWHLAPEAAPLEILYEDDDLLALNKPPGLTVHPGAGCPGGTLVNALVHHCPDLKGIGDIQRPGLVHRLDKDTSGVMVVAKTSLAHEALQRQFQDRRVDKKYLALVWGRLAEAQGEITQKIGRHPTLRHKMAVASRGGREAATSWRRLRDYAGPMALLELTLHTGRTHQIRVHMASLGHPVVGDKVYGGGDKRLLTLGPDLLPLQKLVSRQLLHAWKLTIHHPGREEEVRLEAPLPLDFQAVLNFLENRSC